MRRSPQLNYDLHEQKRIIQNNVFPLISERKVITLAGPNISAYTSMLPNHVSDIEIWEWDRNTMLKQLSVLPNLKGRNLTYVFGDIINAEVNTDAFYDLDFCGSILSTYYHVQKFKDCKFMLTLSIRPLTLKKTLKLFLESVGETAYMDISIDEYAKGHHLLQTGENSYIYTQYCDRTPMLTIFKYKKR